MTNPPEETPGSNSSDRRPYRVRLPGFISDEQIGLGDVVQRATSYLGIRPCGGCTQRRDALNQRMVFTNGRRG
jgi:hypothetical protein